MIKDMKRIALLLAAAPLLAFSATSTPQGFTDNLDDALASAKANNKFVYLCFSGSDWCSWCQKLEKEVFSRPGFIDAVTNAYELVFIDTPEDKSCLSERAKTENPKLVQKYGVKGFPMALILDSSGALVVETGYRRGGARAYAEYLLEMREKGPEIKLATELAKRYIEPFQAGVHAILREEIARPYEAAMAGVATAEAKAAKEKELTRTLLPAALAKLEPHISAFAAQEVPDAIAEHKRNALAEVEVLVKKMKEQLAGG